jgi:hypothetical protein
MEKIVRIINRVRYIDVRFRIEDDGSLDVRGVTNLLGFKKDHDICLCSALTQVVGCVGDVPASRITVLSLIYN